MKMERHSYSLTVSDERIFREGDSVLLSMFLIASHDAVPRWAIYSFGTIRDVSTYTTTYCWVWWTLSIGRWEINSLNFLEERGRVYGDALHAELNRRRITFDSVA